MGGENLEETYAQPVPKRHYVTVRNGASQQRQDNLYEAYKDEGWKTRHQVPSVLTASRSWSRRRNGNDSWLLSTSFRSSGASAHHSPKSYLPVD